MSAHHSPDLLERVRQQLLQQPPVRYGNLILPSRYLLSPLAGYTNLPFRRIVRELGGVGLATTDLVNARGLLDGGEKTLRLIQSHPHDRPFAVQIFGGDASTLAEATRFLYERGVDSVDINMGCPVSRIVKGGAGASLMCQVDPTLQLVRTVVEAAPLPVTVKMRLGWDDTHITAPQFAREFEQLGVAAVAIHGRTRAQGFSGNVNRAGIRQVVEAVSRIPVVGNGDIRTLEDAARMFAETGCHAISMGRGALANPWIFHQFAHWEQTGERLPNGTFAERLTLLLTQFQYLRECRGEERAISMFRKMAHWYLKAMRIPSVLRNEFQQAATLEEFFAMVEKVREYGLENGLTGELPDMHIPVPSGPVELW